MDYRNLIIIRHAKSSWDDSSLGDHERPLNKRGIANAPVMASRLLSLNVNPEALLSSTALRAATTAQVFAKALNFPPDQITYNSDLYLASAGMLQDLIAGLANDLKTVLIFGHNPGLTLLASQIWEIPIGNIPTCGVVSLKFKDLDWRNASSQKPYSTTFDFPKNSTTPIDF